MSYQIVVKGNSILPVGYILHHGNSVSLSTITLPCDGRVLSKTKFKELFDVIGTTYGSTDKTFNLPSLSYSYPINTRLTYQDWWEKRPCVFCKEVFGVHDRNTWWCTTLMEGKQGILNRSYLPMDNLDYLRWKRERKHP